MSLTPEEKLIAKVVRILAADSVLEGYVDGRIYASHISSIDKPSFPAISVYLQNSRSIFYMPGSVQVTIQIDAWIPARVYTSTDILAIQERLRSLLHRAHLTDSTESLVVANMVETSSGPLLYEDDTELFHYPTEYQAVAT